jgi:hypothetical protein
MGRQQGEGNKGLKRGPLARWVHTCQNLQNEDKKMLGLLAPFTGIRATPLLHIHGPTSLNYTAPDTEEVRSDDGIPKMKVHSTIPCYKDGNPDEPCSDCKNNGHLDGVPTKYNDEREIPLPETWQNWAAGDSHDEYVEEELGLRSFVKSYFKVTEDDYGKEMIGGDGISHSCALRWIKDIAQRAEIGYERGTIISSELGEVPDVYLHDMRGTYVMMLIRNDMHRTLLTQYTGHENVSSLEPYEKRVREETPDKRYLDHI